MLRLAEAALQELAGAYRDELCALPLDARGLSCEQRRKVLGEEVEPSHTSAFASATPEYIARHAPTLVHLDSPAHAKFAPRLYAKSQSISTDHVAWLLLLGPKAAAALTGCNLAVVLHGARVMRTKLILTHNTLHAVRLEDDLLRTVFHATLDDPLAEAQALGRAHFCGLEFLIVPHAPEWKALIQPL